MVSKVLRRALRESAIRLLNCADEEETGHDKAIVIERELERQFDSGYRAGVEDAEKVAHEEWIAFIQRSSEVHLVSLHAVAKRIRALATNEPGE